MSVQLCSKIPENEWIVDIPSDVIYLSELFEYLEEMNHDISPTEIPFKCTKEDLLEGFECLRKVNRMYDEIRSFNKPKDDIVLDELEAIRLRVNNLYCYLKQYKSSELYEFMNIKVKFKNAIEGFENRTSPIGYLNSTIINDDNIKRAFCDMCAGGHMSMAKWLYYKVGGIRIDTINHAFKLACMNGRETVAKWLHCELGEFDTHVIGNAFRAACRYGNKSVAKWLYYEVGGVEKKPIVDAFESACMFGHEVIAKWIFYQVGGMNVYRNNCEVYRHICMYGQESIAKWFNSEFNDLSKYVNNEKAFELACTHGHTSLARWLYKRHDGVSWYKLVEIFNKTHNCREKSVIDEYMKEITVPYLHMIPCPCKCV